MQCKRVGSNKIIYMYNNRLDNLTVDCITSCLIERLQAQLEASIQQGGLQSNPDLFSGSFGVWFSLYQCQKHLPERVSELLLAESLEALLKYYRYNQKDLSCSGGLAGIGWLLEYLYSDQQWSIDHNDELAELYLKVLSVETWEKDYEFILGLTGYAPFVLRRAGRCKRSMQLAVAWLTQLELLAQYDQHGGCFWVTPLSSSFRKKRHNPLHQEVNLGMAHGVVGTLNALCKAAEIPELRGRALRLINAGAQYLLRQQNDKSYLSLYPYLAGEQQSSRLGWCYGDLPIALLFSRLAVITANDVYAKHCHALIQHILARNAGSGQVSDGGICHGAAGIWLVLNQIHQLNYGRFDTDNLGYWAGWLLDHFFKHQDTGMGFACYMKGNFTQSDGLLEGNAGVLLVLLLVKGYSADWLDLLLLA